MRREKVNEQGDRNDYSASSLQRQQDRQSRVARRTASFMRWRPSETRRCVMGKSMRKIIPSSSQPRLHVHGREIQEFGTVRLFPLGLSHDARTYSCQRLNQLLADTQV